LKRKIIILLLFLTVRDFIITDGVFKISIDEFYKLVLTGREAPF